MSTTAVLTPADVEEFGRELDKIRDEIIGSLGEQDAKYIRGVIAMQRKLELAGRALLFASWLPPAWVAGTTALATAKILENMESSPPPPNPATARQRTRRIARTQPIRASATQSRRSPPRNPPRTRQGGGEELHHHDVQRSEGAEQERPRVRSRFHGRRRQRGRSVRPSVAASTS
jgi:hypothetical protein